MWFTRHLQYLLHKAKKSPSRQQKKFVARHLVEIVRKLKADDVLFKYAKHGRQYDDLKTRTVLPEVATPKKQMYVKLTIQTG